MGARVMSAFCEDRRYQPTKSPNGTWVFPARNFTESPRQKAAQLVAQNAVEMSLAACQRFPDDWGVQSSCLEVIALMSEHKLLKNRGKDRVSFIRVAVKAARRSCPRHERDTIAILKGRIES